MNIFYAPPSQINNGYAELLDQEAIHASKVMRAREGDKLTIVDGEGGHYRGIIRRITKKSVQVEIEDAQHHSRPKPHLVLGMGIIKKRDRLEFAVEKAIELGAAQICLFRSEHTIKENVRMDRLESLAISAMKQSLQAHLSTIEVYHSLDVMLESVFADNILVAHEKVDEAKGDINYKSVRNSERTLLLVGPEGGFSESEIRDLTDKGGELVSLGPNRLRAETAAIAFMSQFL
ncbi:RsmE family RNA methyltransferase [Fodinibius sp.]|uniref:RsmE family RNA methyltransferase n=1 Tax=Fodinibius sp. TaxID=1872440 RepID=UPI002ACD2C94|nr:RsmE family RNA methyltransferase [Fodinibius sp.]MDZ7660711.1 RsmE family RNA methyltransferase [Fodinibius sp.]